MNAKHLIPSDTASARRLVQSQSINRERGFSLVELMIALVLGLLVVAGASSVLISNKGSYRTNEALSRIQENSRIAFELISRDLRGAALTGCGNSGRVANILNDGTVKSTTPDWYANFDNSVIGYTGTTTVNPAVSIGTNKEQRITGTDSLTVLGAADTGYGIGSHTLGTKTITIRESNPDLNAGDIVVICDPDHAVVAQISSGNGTSGTYVIDNSANCSNGLGYPTQCTADGTSYQFAINSQISKLKASSWYIGMNQKGGSSLYRMTLGNTAVAPTAGAPTTVAQEMVRDVTGLAISYHLKNGTGFSGDASTVSAANWANVDAVQITLTLQAEDKTTGTTRGKFITRQLTALITLRNRAN